MKNLFYVISCLFVIVGCSNDSDNQNDFKSNQRIGGKITVNDLISDPSEVGIIHNEVMDSIYVRLMQLKDDKIDLMDSPEEFINFHVTENLNAIIDFDSVDVKSYIVVEDAIGHAELNAFAADLSELVDEGLSTVDYIYEANELRKSYLNNSSDDHYDVSLDVIYSVAINSYDYWMYNSSKWEDLISTAQRGGGGRTVNNKTIVKADIKGAVTGAIYGGFAGSGVAGIGAVPGALLGGLISSCAASATSGLSQYFGLDGWL